MITRSAARAKAEVDALRAGAGALAADAKDPPCCCVVRCACCACCALLLLLLAWCFAQGKSIRRTPTPNPFQPHQTVPPSPSVQASERRTSEALLSCEDALRLVARGLAGGLELYGVYGASLAARDLANFARARRAFAAAARDGFEELAAEVARQEGAAAALKAPPFQSEALARLPAGLGWPFWEALWAADPAAAEEAVLKKAAAALNEEVRLLCYVAHTPVHACMA